MIIFQAGDVFAGRFRLEQRIGQGGMGQVWRATQIGLNREVALKLILPNVVDEAHFRSLFISEAQLSAKLGHANIVPVVDFGESDGVLWLVQLFVRGQDLGALLERSGGGGLPIPLATYITSQVLLGLQCAHDHGIVHRDLKPGNVLVSNAGDVQLTDFGIAKVISPNITPSVSTMLKGSPGYLAPEVLRGQPARFTSDLFSVGGLFWELLTGRNPFIAPNSERDQIFFATLNESVPPLASIGVVAPPGLDEIIHRLLAKDPVARYQNAGLVLEDLVGVTTAFARDATALGLRRYVASLHNTVATMSTPAGGQPDGPRPSSLGISAMAGQIGGSTGPPPRTTPPVSKTRASWRAMATLTAVTILVGVVVLTTRHFAGSPTPPKAQPANPTPLTTSATPDASPPPQLFTLTIDVTPTDARVFADGRPLEDRPPYRLKGLPAGAHVAIRAEKDGFVAHQETVIITASSTAKISLEPARAGVTATTPGPAPAETGQTAVAPGDVPPKKPDGKRPKPAGKRPPPDDPEMLPL